MQSMHTPATGAPTACQEGEASVPNRMASRSPMVATCQWGDVVRCLPGVPPARCATVLGDWQQTIAPYDRETTRQFRLALQVIGIVGKRWDLNHRYRNVAGAHPPRYQRSLPSGVSHWRNAAAHLPTYPAMRRP